MIDRTIRAVVFDFGNVICSFSVPLFIDGISRKSGKSVEELLHVMPGISRLSVKYETGLLSSDQYFEQLCILAGITVSRDDFIQAYTGIFAPITGTHALIRALKPSYVLGLLSNTNEWHYLHSIRTLELFHLFDAVSLSFEVKAMKPAPEIYHDMLGKLRLPPECCAYIDDMPENVEAAARLGMHAIRYTDPVQLRNSLAQIGVRT